MLGKTVWGHRQKGVGNGLTSKWLRDYHDVLLKDLCIEDHADVGMYGVKFFVNGKWVTVLIDDR